MIYLQSRNSKTPSIVFVLVLTFMPGAALSQSSQPSQPTAPTQTDGLALGAPDISAAVATGDPARITLAVVAAIAENPANVQGIVRDAIDRAPRYRRDIVDAAVTAFPAFEDRIAAATGTAAPGEAAEAIAGTAVQANQAPVSTVGTKTPGKWAGEISLGGSRATGNTETEQVNAAVKITHKSAPWESTLQFKYDFASDSGGINTQRMDIAGDTEYSFTDRVFAFGLLEYVDDRFAGFDYEITQAAGMGYKLIKTETVDFKMSAGPGVRLSKRKDTGETEVEPIGRVNADFAWKISDSATFNNDTAITWGTKRRITENTTALTMKIIARLAGRLSYEVRHNSKPGTDTKKTDTLTKAALVYDF
ncbi:MAG: DUF481 domain-containing protein [Rhodospirillales bacterium]